MPKIPNIIQRELFVDECVVEGKSIRESYRDSNIKKLSNIMFKKILKSKTLRKHFDSKKASLGFSDVTFEQFVNTTDRAFGNYARERAEQYAIQNDLYADAKRKRTGKVKAEAENYNSLAENPMKSINIINKSKKTIEQASKALSDNPVVKELLGEYGEKMFKKQINNINQIPLYGFIKEIEHYMQAKTNKAA